MGNKPLSPDFDMRGYQIENKIFKENSRRPHARNPYPQRMVERATDLAFRSSLGILEPNRDTRTPHSDDSQDEITVAIRRNVPDAVEFLVDNGYLGPYTPGYGHPITEASDTYRSMLRRGDTLDISKAARILALLLVADPKLIDNLEPYQRGFITDPVFQQAIIKRTGEVAAKRRGAATTAWGMRRRNAINAANARRQAAAAPTTIAEHSGGLRPSKTQRRHRSTSARTSKRLRRRTAQKSRK
jgi:hypothetical protein